MRVDLAASLTPVLAAEAVRAQPAPRAVSSPRPADPALRESDPAILSTQTEAAEREVSREDLAKVLARLNATIQRLEPHLEFTMAGGNNRVVVKLVDGVRHEVLRQYPTPDIIELSKHLDDLRGLLVKEDA